MSYDDIYHRTASSSPYFSVQLRNISKMPFPEELSGRSLLGSLAKKRIFCNYNKSNLIVSKYIFIVRRSN